MNSMFQDVMFPRVFRLRQQFERPVVADIAAEVHRQLASLDLNKRIKPGESVAITAGSRGIANIVNILQSAVAFLQELGAAPFIVPAMGSHGGATADGQQQVLERYGITESSMGCPIRATMETNIVCDTPIGFPIHADRNACEADHVLVIGRVKPHTMYAGPIESGLCKMLLIGLGKHTGARIYHSAAHTIDFQTVVETVVPRVVPALGVCGGLAIIENAYDETARVQAVPSDAILDDEPALLEQAKSWMPKLPFGDIDVLIVDEIGKNISGTGLDTNVVGRKFDDNKATSRDAVSVLRIIARDLTPETHGNASGIGIVDLITRRLYDKIDFETTWINCFTAGHIGGAKMAPVLETDEEAIAAGLGTLGLRAPKDARLLWIKNTLEVSELWASECFLEEAEQQDNMEVLSEPVTIQSVLGNYSAG